MALSYVRGLVKVYRAKKQDFVFHAGESYPSLPLVDLEIPRTIEDAITVVRMIGERYLWVDALCIQQDNPRELREMIRNMDQVFKNSILTIVAESGEHADEGL